MNDDTLELDPRFRAGLAALWAESRDRHLGAADEILAGLGSAGAGGGVNDSVGAAAAAHRLAGTLGVFGLPSASESARRIEEALDSDAADELSADMHALAERLRNEIAEHRIDVG